MLYKNAIKAAKRTESALLGNFRDFQFCLPQQATGFMNTQGIDVLAKVDLKLFAKYVRKIAWTYIKGVRNVLKTYF